ncbi:hypothetical protein [Microcoleus sp. FACHB-68]|uniref:hypothetical protein n=1 Tax=Microcoleus sp. FACHB-68 TaxID=2692826 RepID=UPI0016898D2A|nr:hypothetical protein [Microcoleus sp. FACHB-68]MBD1936839.1 hypothetical protein [Microcoleus sp. FACHB-68]
MNEQLEPRFINAGSYNPRTQRTQQGQDALTQLVEEILRGRTICRPLSGYSLSEVQKEIYEQLRTQLFSDVSQEITKYNLQRTPLKVWGNHLLHQALKAGLQDEQLKQLAIEIQKQPSNSALRRHLLGELVEAIRLSGKLCRPHREKFSPDFYELLYEEAVIRTLAYVCKNIDNYDPERGQTQKFMTWVNFRLDKLVIECRREFSNPIVEELPSIADLENIAQPASTSLVEETRQYIESDPGKIFEKKYIRSRPDASFKTIALARLSGQSWEEISSSLGIKVSVLSGFFQRCCSKFRPQFQKDLPPD